MRAIAVGLFAVAVAIQTFNWIVKKYGIDSQDETLPASPNADKPVPAVALSPFRKASFDSANLPDGVASPVSDTQAESAPAGPALSMSSTEPAHSPLLRPRTPIINRQQGLPQPKALHFEEKLNGETSRRLSGISSDGEVSSCSSSSSNDDKGFPYAFKDNSLGVAHAAVHVHTPDSANQPKENEDLNGSQDKSEGTRHRSKQPSFPEIDYEPERIGFRETQASRCEMAPAPTEEGDAIARVEEVLADMEEQAMLGQRRHSRSFSEPNLAAKVLQQRVHATQEPSPDGGHSSEEEDRFPIFREDDCTDDSQESPGALRDGQEHMNGICDPSSKATKRYREEEERPPLLRLEILSGPSSGREITIDDADTQVSVGRFPDNYLYIEDREVSGKHALLNWDRQRRTWQVRDMGSMNGTRLNGTFISSAARRPGKHWQLSSDDILLLGSRTAIKIIYLPNAVVQHFPHLKKLYAPPSGLHPTLTLKSEAMATLRAELTTEKSFQEKTLRLEGAVVCQVGVEHQRTGNACEDVPFCGEPGRYQAALYCVFDGHIGRKSASNCTKLLPEELRKRMAEVQPSLDEGLGVGHRWEEVFLATDAALDSTERTEDGTTATALLVWKDKLDNLCLQTANVGDSAAVFCKTGQDPKTEFVKMTVDHRISDPGERKRLAALGIELGKNKTRLYGMNLSRCLGDHFIKSADLGFTAVPSVSEVMQLAPAESGLVVIASDGLWDVAEPGRVMEVAFGAKTSSDANPEAIADAIYQYAMKQRSRDDVCIIVLSLSTALAKPLQQ